MASICVQEFDPSPLLVPFQKARKLVEALQRKFRSTPTDYDSVAPLDLFAKYAQADLQKKFPSIFTNPENVYCSVVGPSDYKLTNWGTVYKNDQGSVGIHLIENKSPKNLQPEGLDRTYYLAISQNFSADRNDFYPQRPPIPQYDTSAWFEDQARGRGWVQFDPQAGLVPARDQLMETARRILILDRR